jgi:hypothetical protein
MDSVRVWGYLRRQQPRTITVERDIHVHTGNLRLGRWIFLAGLAPPSAVLLVVPPAYADASYQETVQVTGGSLVDAFKKLPFMPKSMKQMLEPIVSRKAVHGNQLVSISSSSTEIIDLDQETLTQLDNQQRTYSVVTFAQMRQAFKNAPKKLEEAQAKAREQQPASPGDQANPPPQVKVTFEINVADTGATKPINGVTAKEQIMTMKAHVTDANPPPDKPPQAVTYTMITDVWTAPEPPEMKEIDEFYVRYGKKLMQGVDAAALMKAMQPAVNGSAMAALFASQPGAGPAAQDMMQKMATEMQKIKGTRILEVTRMGGETMAPPAAGDIPPPPAGDSTAAVAQPSATSKLGALGSMLGKSMLGGLRGNSMPAAQDTPPSDAAQPTNTVLYESTSQKSDFSREAVSATLFQLPAGFKQVDSAMVQSLSH